MTENYQYPYEGDGERPTPQPVETVELPPQPTSPLVPRDEPETCTCGFRGNPNMSTHDPKCDVAIARANRAEMWGHPERPKMVDGNWSPDNETTC